MQVECNNLLSETQTGEGWGGKNWECRNKIKKSYIIKSATLLNMKNIDDKNINYFITENKMQFWRSRKVHVLGSIRYERR